MTLFPFGEVRASERLGGLSNTSFKVTTDTQILTLRFFTPGHNPVSHIALEIEVLQHLARKQFNAPRLLAGEDGAFLQRWHGYTLTATEFIEGVSADTLPLTAPICAGAGRLLANFQAALRDFMPSSSERGGNFFLPDGDTLTPLQEAAASKDILVDAEKLLAQWKRAGDAFKAHVNTIQSGWLHADFWPPNVVCHEGEVTALIDFDNCCYGALITDFAVGLLEFAMPRSITLNRDAAEAFLGGYLMAGGNGAELVPERIVEAMEMACVLWLYWEIIELPALVEGETCLRRLALFDDPGARAAFTTSLVNVLNRGRALAEDGGQS
jgi:Ser/Thr protein kinase RdoA (MazF antagonist)